MMWRDTGLSHFDPNSSDDYVPLQTKIYGWAMATEGSRRPRANIRPQTVTPAAGAAPGSVVKRRWLLALGLSYVIADIAVDDAPRPRRVVALCNATVAGFIAYAPHGLSLCSIAEPALSVRPDRSDADGAVLPLGLLLLI